MHLDIRTKADAIRWYHTIDLGNGVVTRGVDNTAIRLARLDLPPLAGKTVLDVGAWDGFFSFEAERRGASRVVASDYYSWHGMGWDTGKGKAGFELAREVLESRVEDVDMDVMELTPDRVGTFDVVFFLGVLYHVKNPLAALERVASVTRELLILETVIDMVGIDRPACAFYPGAELGGDPTNWWGPNPPAVHGMLRSVGFEEVRTITPMPSRFRRFAKGIVHAARKQNGFRAAYRQDRAVFHARKGAMRG